MFWASSANQPGLSFSVRVSSAKNASSSSFRGMAQEAVVALLGLQAQMHEQGGVAAVVQDHVGRAAVFPLEDACASSPSIPRASRPCSANTGVPPAAIAAAA